MYLSSLRPPGARQVGRPRRALGLAVARPAAGRVVVDEGLRLLHDDDEDRVRPAARVVGGGLGGCPGRAAVLLGRTPIVIIICIMIIISSSSTTTIIVIISIIIILYYL